MRGYDWFDHDAAMSWRDIRVIPLEPASAGIALPDSVEDSPGVFEARKGVVAAAKGDWAVALAWYQTALQKDPRNAALSGMAADAASHLPPNR
jgi:hypothetical protein